VTTEWSSARVLVVDDDPTVSDVLTALGDEADRVLRLPTIG
jgi:CheY-like chemotaxis protein